MAKKYHIVPVENIMPEGVFVYNEETGKATFSNPQASVIEERKGVNMNDITKEYMETNYSGLPDNVIIIFTNILDNFWSTGMVAKVSVGFIMMQPGTLLT
jgi:hypothetical protein